MGVLDIPGYTRAQADAKYLPTLVADWNADNLTGADGSAVSVWTDSSAFAWKLRQITTASQPTLKANIINGHQVVRTGASGWMQCASFGPFAMPTTIMAVAKTSGTTGQRTLFSAVVSTAVQSIYIDSTRLTWGLSAGAAAVGGDPADNNFHILTAHFENGYASLSVDGIPVNVVSGVGSNALYGMLLGQNNGGGSYWNGDVARVKVWNAKLTPDQEAAEGAALAATYGLTFAPAKYRMDSIDVATSNGQAARIWVPQDGLPASGPIIIYSHPHAQNERVGPGNQGAALIAACVAQGWPVIASNGHANNWGNQNVLDDNLDAYNYMAARMTVTKVIMIGSSMGGLASSLAVPDGRIPNIKGVVGIDAVFNLANLYGVSAYTSAIDTAYGITRGTLSGATSAGGTSLPTTSSFPTVGTLLVVGNGTANREVVTTTGASNGTSVAVTAFANSHASGDQVSDYGTKTAGHDPVLKTAGNYGTVGFRFYAATADVDVNKAANADTMAALVTGAPERVVQSLTQAHLDPSHTMPVDAVAFIKRMIV